MLLAIPFSTNICSRKEQKEKGENNATMTGIPHRIPGNLCDCPVRAQNPNQSITALLLWLLRSSSCRQIVWGSDAAKSPHVTVPPSHTLSAHENRPSDPAPPTPWWAASSVPLSPGAQQAKFGSNDSICMRYMNHVTILHMTMLCQPPKKISWGGKHVPGLGEPHVMYERCRLTK